MQIHIFINSARGSMQRFDLFIKYYDEYCTLEIVYIVLHIMYSTLYAFLLTRSKFAVYLTFSYNYSDKFLQILTS